MTVYRRGAGIISSAVLFALVFASQESGFVIMNAQNHGASLGLLLFLVPGVVGGLLSQANKIVFPVLGALLASPLCLVIFSVARSEPASLWYQMTYLLSAVFWCACGALGWYFIGVMFKRPAH